jgi:hypothetical protein
MITLKPGASVAKCPNHKEPKVSGDFLSYEVTDSEHNSWKKLSNEERTALRDEASSRCFYEVLHDAISRNKKV